MPVEIEVKEEEGHGAPRILGLPDAVVRESLYRIRSVFEAWMLPFPRGQIVVNLAPAASRKDGSGFDLPLALALAAVAGIVPPGALAGWVALGELALDGRLRGVPGAVAAAVMAREQGLGGVLCASCDAPAAARVPGVGVHSASDFPGAVGVLRGETNGTAPAAPQPAAPPLGEGPSLAEVRGQETARRALVAAAAGGHNLLLVGPPGCGKTFLVRRLPPLLPPLGEAEHLEVLRIHSAHGVLTPEIFAGRPPFRAPHHTASFVGLVGGGPRPRPGEITLAHRGVLFLDELPEFRREVLETLRQPMEEGQIRIARARYAVSMPARFLLVAAMNPCPCGFLGHPARACVCTPHARRRYRERVSGPLLDRMDLQVEMPPAPARELLEERRPGEDAGALRGKVAAARALQRQRLEGLGLSCNAEIPHEGLDRLAPLSREGRGFLAEAMAAFSLSARSLVRVRRVARTLADLAGREHVEPADLAEAVQLRALDLSTRAA